MEIDSKYRLGKERATDKKVLWRGDPSDLSDKSRKAIYDYVMHGKADAGLFLDALDDLAKGGRVNWSMPGNNINFRSSAVYRTEED